LIVQLASGGEFPHVTGSWIDDGESLLEHCVFDEGTYWNRDDARQKLARNILASRHAIVVMPRRPLRQGFSYRTVIEVNGQLIDWTFAVDRQ
jgi:hypothetical protein